MIIQALALFALVALLGIYGDQLGLNQNLVYFIIIFATLIIFFHTEIKNYFLSKKNKIDPETMVDRKLGFELDWKWIPSDILFEIKKIVPSFTYKVEDESDPYEKKIVFKGVILGEKMEFHTPNDKPYDFIKRINPKLIKLINKKFREVDTDGDYCCFILESV